MKTDIISIIASLFTGFMAIFLVLERTGFFQYIFKKKNGGNGNVQEHRIKDLETHADVANREMGDIRKDISDIKTDLAWVRGKLDGKI